MANLKSEQLDINMKVVIDQNDVVQGFGQYLTLFKKHLGANNVNVEVVCNKKVISFVNQSNSNKKIILLFKAITYLGGNGQHPIFKKRIQLPSSWKKFVTLITQKNPSYDVRFLGIYKYKENIIYVDFDKTKYLNKIMHNSSAHVYVNDLFMGMRDGIFSKIDKFNNLITIIKPQNLFNYFSEKSTSKNDLFKVFNEYNKSFFTGKDICAINAIGEMHDGLSPNWRQAEWAGFFLEFQLNKFLKSSQYENLVKYIGSDRQDNQYDYDLSFYNGQFFGDLKASDILKNNVIGNDKTRFLKYLDQYERFWYVIYQHTTIKDADVQGFPASIYWNNLINKFPQKKNFKNKDLLSYSQRMKYSVNFQNMYILEVNKFNIRYISDDFLQGQQPSGKSRNPKLLFHKKNIENFIIYRFCAN